MKKQLVLVLTAFLLPGVAFGEPLLTEPEDRLNDAIQNLNTEAAKINIFIKGHRNLTTEFVQQWVPRIIELFTSLVKAKEEFITQILPPHRLPYRKISDEEVMRIKTEYNDGRTTGQRKTEILILNMMRIIQMTEELLVLAFLPPNNARGIFGCFGGND